MGNKETKRTIIVTKMLFNYCIVIIFLLLHLTIALATEIKADTESIANVTITEANSTSLQPVAEPLVRYRRQPPRTIVRHIIRPKRMKIKRVKRPKIHYSFAEPPTTYYRRKPSYSYSSSSKAPTFDSSMFEDLSHYNVESSDFDLPSSSYETHSMDLDLYKNYEAPAEAPYKEIQKSPSYEYSGPEVSYKEPESSYKEIQKSPSYEYAAPEESYKAPEVSYGTPEVSYKEPTKTYYIPSTNSETRKPHSQYGVPTDFVYSTGYNKPSGNKYSYESTSSSFKPSKPIYSEVEKPSYKEEYSYSVPKGPLRIPATKYGVPDLSIPSKGINDYYKYSLIERKPSHAGYSPTKTDIYHFAEPPQPEPNVEITYSPSYEINIPSSHESGKYNRSPQPSYEESPKYEDSPQQYDHPQGNYPEQSNTYHSSPPSQQNYDQHPGYQEGSGSNQPPSYHPAPPPSHHASIEEYIPQTQDLPINVNYEERPYNYPKSSYEVPIYDAIPFDNSNTKQQDIYPPQSYEHSQSQHNSNSEYIAEPNNISEQRPDQHQPESEETPAGDAHSSGTRPSPQSTTSPKPISPITRLRKTRKRKRQRGSSTTTSTTKHILDVPELQQAFEKENHNRIQNQEDEIDTNASNKVQNINYNSVPWNPMKIRTSSQMIPTPSSTSSINTFTTSKRRYTYKQRSTTTTTTTTTTTPEPPLQVNSKPNVEIISIERSRSKTYYDGILSTPRVYNPNLFRQQFKFEQKTTASPTPQMVASNGNQFSKRTTKNVFDTTIFKSPLNDRDLYRNLPKNHKLF